MSLEMALSDMLRLHTGALCRYCGGGAVGDFPGLCNIARAKLHGRLLFADAIVLGAARKPNADRASVVEPTKREIA